MIENIPFSLVVLTSILTLLSGVMMTYAFVRGHHRTQQRAHMFALALLGWSIFQATLALKGLNGFKLTPSATLDLTYVAR